MWLNPAVIRFQVLLQHWEGSLFLKREENRSEGTGTEISWIRRPGKKQGSRSQ